MQFKRIDIETLRIDSVETKQNNLVQTVQRVHRNPCQTCQKSGWYLQSSPRWCQWDGFTQNSAVKYFMALYMDPSFETIWLLVFKVPTPMTLEPSGYIMSVNLSVRLYLIQRPNYNWLLQVMWHKNYWNTDLSSTVPRLNASTSLVA